MMWLIGYIIIGFGLALYYLVRYTKTGKMTNLSKRQKTGVYVLFALLYSVTWAPIEICSLLFMVYKIAKIHGRNTNSNDK